MVAVTVPRHCNLMVVGPLRLLCLTFKAAAMEVWKEP